MNVLPMGLLWLQEMVLSVSDAQRSAGHPWVVGTHLQPLGTHSQALSLLWLGEVLGKWPALCVLRWAGRRKHRGHLVGANNTSWVVLQGSLQLSHPNSGCPGCVTSLLLLLFHCSVCDSAESRQVCVPCLPLAHTPLSLGIVSDSENCPEMRTPWGIAGSAQTMNIFQRWGAGCTPACKKGVKCSWRLGQLDKEMS